MSESVILETSSEAIPGDFKAIPDASAEYSQNNSLAPNSNRKHRRNTETYVKSYRQNFSIHGLAKIFEGAFFEQIFWFLILAASLGFIAFKCNEFYTEYTKYDIRTEVRIKSDNRITLPALTVCKSYRLYGEDIKGFVNEVECYRNKSLTAYDEYANCRDPKSDTYVKPMSSHSIFPYFQYHPDFPSCSTINPNGTITSQSDVLQNHFSIKWPRELSGYLALYLYVHDQDDLPFSTGKLFSEELSISGPGYYLLSIGDKIVTHRKQHPFPSNCTNGENNESIFPKPYTFKKCQDTCLFYKMLNNCGTVLDHWQKYAKGKYPTNKTDEETKHCLKQALRITNKDCQCPFSCNETAYEAVFRISSPKTRIVNAEIQMVYSKNTFTLIQEHEAYPKNKFLTDIGGWCGLFSGMSFLSLVEILVFAVLSTVGLFEKFRISKK